jgi:hypothetical protein
MGEDRMGADLGKGLAGLVTGAAYGNMSLPKPGVSQIARPDLFEKPVLVCGDNGSYLGHEVGIINCERLLSSGSDQLTHILFRTNSGNIYCIAKTTNGGFSIRNGRKGELGDLIDTSELTSLTLELGTSFKCSKYQTSEVTEIIAVNTQELLASGGASLHEIKSRSLAHTQGRISFIFSELKELGKA